VKQQSARTTQTGGTAADSARQALLALREEIGKAVVGQDAVVSGLMRIM
jgi:MoxR-like ATPase